MGREPEEYWADSVGARLPDLRDAPAPEPPPAVPGYRLGELLGAGGHGVVWRATRESDGLACAVKVVPLAGAPEQAERDLREFTVLHRVVVEGVVRLHDVVALPAGDGPVGSRGGVALVLDLLDGGSLASVLAARGHLSAGEAVTVLASVAGALAGLHAAGVVHADLAPGNVLFELTGRPVLADLGVSRLAGEAPGERFATDGFAAPEVEGGAPATPASDVYALGALAWLCVTGQAPGPVALRGRLEDLASVPEAYAAVLRRCLAPDPAARPSAAEAALAFFDAVPCEPLRLVVGSDEVSLLTRRLRSIPVGPDGDEGARERGRRQAVAWWRRRAGAAALVLSLASAAGVGTAVLTGRVPAGMGVPGQGSSPGPSVQAPVVDPSPARRDPQASPEAPTAEPRALVQALADRRAAVLMREGERGLGSVDLAGSPAWEADEAALATLTASSQRYEGVRFSVVAARALSHEGGRAALVTVVDTAAYRLVGPDGRVTERPATTGRPVRLELRWTNGRWLVEAVAEA